MALPKKTKLDININPPRVGFDYLEYGMDRIEQLIINSDKKTKFLPRTIKIEDIDLEVNEYIENNELQLILDGEKVPVIYLDNERWGEFSKTWKLMDGDKNVPTPYITIRRSEKAQGTRLGIRYRIAQNRAFRYLDVPIQDEGQIINLRFKIPEPTNIDLTYQIRLLTKYRQDINEFDENVLRNFGSFQGYIFVKGNPMPIYLQSIEESNTIDNIDGDRFFMGMYTLLVKGFIQDEKEFEITKTSRLPRIGIDLS